MPAYNESRLNAIFFVTFIIVGVFYLHSLVLSVVFQVFVQSANEVHHRSSSDKEESIRLAFYALALATNNKHDDDVIPNSGWPPNALVDSRLVFETLRLLRPHYNGLKLKVLLKVIVPSYAKKKEQDCVNGPSETNQHLDYSHFRMRMTQALSSSIRITRSRTTLGWCVEVLSGIVSIFNFIYVILLTSNYQANWFVKSEFAMGSLITLLALAEAGIRYNPLKASYRMNPISRVNAILDGVGALGALLSLTGIIWYSVGHVSGLEFLLTGRAIGMIQSMRFTVWFREVLQRSLHVLPFLSGPIFMVLMTIHVFVCIGMALWGGAVDPDELAANGNLEELFYLNNFNSYGEGCITIFNVLVVNDWHQIAK
jgi:hypothetical protein